MAKIVRNTTAPLKFDQWLVPNQWLLSLFAAESWRRGTFPDYPLTGLSRGLLLERSNCTIRYP